MAKTSVIALEEHYLDPEVTRHFKEGGPEARVPEAWYERPAFYFSNPHVVSGQDLRRRSRTAVRR